MTVRWFDTHVHLDRYDPAEALAMTERAAAAGVARMLAVSTSPASSERTMALASNVMRAVGVHPARADAESLRWLAETRLHVAADAVGECGFDDAGPAWDMQEGVFAAQTRLAREAGKPLVLHIDGPAAWERLTSVGASLEGLTVVRHYFRGAGEQVRWHAERGHYVSFGRPLLRDAELREMARLVPAARLLIETDTYPVEGRATEPRDVVEVGAALAEVRGWTLEECAEVLWANAARALSPAGDAARSAFLLRCGRFRWW